jgi:hypothetical protein
MDIKDMKLINFTAILRNFKKVQVKISKMLFY